jgi:SPP1 gp7 family putative phage head morphogenesis protein
MKSADYWRQRSEQVAKQQYDKADQYASDLDREYARSLKSIQEDIERFYLRYAINNEISLAETRKLLTGKELKEFKMTLEEFTAKAKDNADGRWTQELNNVYYRTRISRFEALQVQIRQQVEMLAASRQQGTGELLGGIYEDTYYQTLYELQKGTGFGVSFARIDKEGLETVLSTEFAGSNWSKRIWGDRDKLVNELRTKIAQSFIRGDTVEKAIRDVTDRMNVSRSYAERLVQTESAFFTGQATMAGYKASGVVQKYEILATLDSRTSTICRGMDGKVFALSEMEVSVNYPPFHARCRTTTVAAFDDEIDPGERIARDEEGNTYFVPGNITYEKWKQQILQQNGIILKGSYSDAYRKKLMDTYQYFKAAGFHMTEHSLNRVLGRIQQGRLPDVQTILDTMRNGKTYVEPDGTVVKFGNGVSVHFADDNFDVKSVVPNKKPKKDWREVDESN